MPRVGNTFTLVGANGHMQLTSTGTGNVQTLTLETSCAAVLLAARPNNGIVTFDGSTPTTGNGLDIIAGAQPLLIPLGYMAHSAHQVKFISSLGGNSVLNVIQLN